MLYLETLSLSLSLSFSLFIFLPIILSVLFPLCAVSPVWELSLTLLIGLRFLFSFFFFFLCTSALKNREIRTCTKLGAAMMWTSRKDMNLLVSNVRRVMVIVVNNFQYLLLAMLRGFVECTYGSEFVMLNFFKAHKLPANIPKVIGTIFNKTFKVGKSNKSPLTLSIGILSEELYAKFLTWRYSYGTFINNY